MRWAILSVGIALLILWFLARDTSAPTTDNASGLPGDQGTTEEIEGRKKPPDGYRGKTFIFGARLDDGLQDKGLMQWQLNLISFIGVILGWDSNKRMWAIKSQDGRSFAAISEALMTMPGSRVTETDPSDMNYGAA